MVLLLFSFWFASCYLDFRSACFVCAYSQCLWAQNNFFSLHWHLADVHVRVFIFCHPFFVLNFVSPFRLVCDRLILEITPLLQKSTALMSISHCQIGPISENCSSLYGCWGRFYAESDVYTKIVCIAADFFKVHFQTRVSIVSKHIY